MYRGNFISFLKGERESNMFHGGIIDVHSHLHTKKFLRELEKRTEYPVMRIDELGRKVIHYNANAANVVPESFVDIDHRTKQLDGHNISRQLLSGTNPWTDAFPSAEVAIEFSRLQNDELADIVKISSRRYIALATIPLLSPIDAANELERAIDELGFCGAIIGTNVAGRYLSEEKFLPIFEVASKKKCILFLHPANPTWAGSFSEYGMVRSLGFTFDTTICLVKMAYAGLFDRFPDLRILSAHLGGTLPYLSGRVDTSWTNFEDARGTLDKPPTEKLRKSLFADTISYNKNALRLGEAFFGIERLLFGTDYPFEWGIKPARLSVEEAFEDDDLRKIYEENSERMLRSVTD